MPRTVAIVPHTHWDREWYAPFQDFRLQLVDLLDEFLPILESDPAYRRFLLDGQMAVVDDYLAVRPEADAVLRRLAASGRLSVGPWYTLMDEFLVSGETIVRDLQLGMEKAIAYGGAMPVGYLPDMFGHVAQMPQILRLAGIEHAVVWRGVPSAVTRSAFWWEAPDGSTVRAEYLLSGYGNGEGIRDDAKALVQRVRLYESEVGDQLLDGILFMNGTDHQAPQPWLGRVVAAANDAQHDYRFTITSLPEYLAAAPVKDLPHWRGELRSGARANLLMGVASNRVDVKQGAARAERTLERLAEPLCTLFLPADRWPDALLKVAWTEIIRNAAHDSVCACSADEVVDAVMVRYAEARQLGEGLAERALAALAQSLAEPGPVVVNPSARRRSGVVEIDVPGEDAVAGAQVLRRRGQLSRELVLAASEVAAFLAPIRTQRIGRNTFVNGVDIDDTDDHIDVVLHTGHEPRADFPLEDRKFDLLERVGARPDASVRIRILREPSQRVLVHVGAVPGFGWTRWSPAALAVAPVAASGLVLGNELVRVEVDGDAGTFAFNGHAGLDRLVDDGDAGDTYNYCPPTEDAVIDRPEAVAVEVLEDGPVRARLLVTRRYWWPERVENGRRTGSVESVVRTVLELRAGEDFVRVDATVDNRARDHRLRTWFPLPERTDRSRAECAFAIIERGLEAEGGPTEYGLPTFPSRRFVCAGGLTLLHEGLLEYELVDGGRAIALTLLRATGVISQGPMPYRVQPAGPTVPADGAQLAGRHTLRYAVHIGERDPYALADEAFLPLQVITAPGGGPRSNAGSALMVEGAEVSAVRRVAAGLEVRVFNPSSQPATVTIEGRQGWLVDLRGRGLAPFEGSFTLRPWGICTAHITD